jgi:hypothetical protein
MRDDPRLAATPGAWCIMDVEEPIDIHEDFVTTEISQLAAIEA